MDTAPVWNAKASGKKEAGYRAKARGRPTSQVPGNISSLHVGHLSPKGTRKGALCNSLRSDLWLHGDCVVTARWEDKLNKINRLIAAPSTGKGAPFLPEFWKHLIYPLFLTASSLLLAVSSGF